MGYRNRGCSVRLTVMCFLALVCVLTVCIPADARVWHITPEGTGDAPTIQAGIDSSAAGDTVLVACGTYYEHGLVMKSGVCLRSETGLAACAVISGQMQVGWMFSINDADSTTLVEGFTMHSSGGSGMYCGGSSPVVRNVMLTEMEGLGLRCEGGSPSFDNVVVHLNSLGGVSGNGSATFTNCTVSKNWPGGMSWSGPTVLNSVYFTGNSEGAFVCSGSPGPTLVSCTFHNNYAGVGGFGAMACYGSPTLTGCTFSFNTSEMGPGALDCRGKSSPTLSNCTFRDNHGGMGGAISCLDSSSAEFANCSFLDNHGGSGGAVHCESSVSAFEHCTFSNNYAYTNGGAVACEDSSVVNFANCTLFRNSAGSGGGGLYSAESNVDLENTIIAFSTQGEAVYCDTATSPVSVVCCDIYGNAGGDWVGCIAGECGLSGNISEDPQFCNPDSGDFTLRNDSPCSPYSPSNPGCGLIGALSVGCNNPTGVEHEEFRDGFTFLVEHAAPNPFNPSTVLRFYLPEAGEITISVFDVLGRHVCSLVSGYRPSGWHSAEWAGIDRLGRKVNSGVYYYEARWLGEIRTGRMVLLK